MAECRKRMIGVHRRRCEIGKAHGAVILFQQLAVQIDSRHSAGTHRHAQGMETAGMKCCGSGFKREFFLFLFVVDIEKKPETGAWHEVDSEVGTSPCIFLIGKQRHFPRRRRIQLECDVNRRRGVRQLAEIGAMPLSRPADQSSASVDTASGQIIVAGDGSFPFGIRTLKRPRFALLRSVPEIPLQFRLCSGCDEGDEEQSGAEKYFFHRISRFNVTGHSGCSVLLQDNTVCFHRYIWHGRKIHFHRHGACSHCPGASHGERLFRLRGCSRSGS